MGECNAKVIRNCALKIRDDTVHGFGELQRHEKRNKNGRKRTHTTQRSGDILIHLLANET